MLPIPITKAVVERLIEAMARNFGPCTCQACPVHGQHQCKGCEFLSERDRLCLRADKLNFARWLHQQARLTDGEVPAPAPDRLPW